MSAVSFRQVSRQFGSLMAVKDVSFDIAEGEFFTLLGPSGSGKTTSLRMMAGFEFPSAGEIELFGQSCTRQPPYDRNVNTVFQDYALFPHLNVRDNVAYGLMVRGVSKAERLHQADAMLERVQLAQYGQRKPFQLSGGQRQRVAIARALINQPKVLLLDEPLGALDLKLREQMQSELKKLQRDVGITFVFVTHDQQEALSMSDRICVFNQGSVEQIGTPDDIYDRPASEFVANFVGSVNLFSASEAEQWLGKAQAAMLRPERIHISQQSATDARPGQVVEQDYLGPFIRYKVSLNDGPVLTVNQPNLGEQGQAQRYAVGSNVWLNWPATAVHPLGGS